MSTQEDFLTACLRTLCDAHGGPERVADQAKASAEHLRQILNGTKLPSGNPRHVGRGTAAKLDLAFPGWRSPVAQAGFDTSLSGHVTIALTGRAKVDDLLKKVGETFAATDPDTREAAAPLMGKFVRDPANGTRFAQAISMLMDTSAENP